MVRLLVTGPSHQQLAIRVNKNSSSTSVCTLQGINSKESGSRQRAKVHYSIGIKWILYLINMEIKPETASYTTHLTLSPFLSTSQMNLLSFGVVNKRDTYKDILIFCRSVSCFFELRAFRTETSALRRGNESPQSSHSGWTGSPVCAIG